VNPLDIKYFEQRQSRRAACVAPPVGLAREPDAAGAPP